MNRHKIGLKQKYTRGMIVGRLCRECSASKVQAILLHDLEAQEVVSGVGLNYRFKGEKFVVKIEYHPFPCHLGEISEVTGLGA